MDLADIASEGLGCIHHIAEEDSLAEEGSRRRSFAGDIEDPGCSSLDSPFCSLYFVSWCEGRGGFDDF